MSSNETTNNNEQVTIEEVDEYQNQDISNDTPNYDNTPATSVYGAYPPFGTPLTCAFNTSPSIGAPPANAFGTSSAFGTPLTSAFGAASTTASAAPAFGFGVHPAQVRPAPFPGLIQTGFSFGGVTATPKETEPKHVERHPETGQPIINAPNNSHHNTHHNAHHNAQHSAHHNAHHNAPRSACGGIQPPVSQVFGNDKKKNIDTIYVKLAQARSKIAELNKFLDDIYETLPKIQ